MSCFGPGSATPPAARRPRRSSRRPPSRLSADRRAAPGSTGARRQSACGERLIKVVRQQHDVDGVGKDHHRRRSRWRISAPCARRSPRRRQSTVEVGDRQVDEDHLRHRDFPPSATRFALHFAPVVINCNYAVRKYNYVRTSRAKKAIRRCLRRRSWHGPDRRALVDAADPRAAARAPPLRRP